MTKQDLCATLLGLVILVGVFYVTILGINTIGTGLRAITMAILTTK